MYSSSTVIYIYWQQGDIYMYSSSTAVRCVYLYKRIYILTVRCIFLQYGVYFCSTVYIFRYIYILAVR